MFTGIIQDIGIIVSITRYDHFLQWVIQLHNIDAKTLFLGSSISCNGCCLTIKSIMNNAVCVDLIKETLKTTNLRSLRIGQKINVERSVKFGEEIGGHLVSGHVMTTATIYKSVTYNYNKTLWIKLNQVSFMKYIFYKGFICIDGVSLTIGHVQKNMFCVFLIPETISNTTIGSKIVGDLVNLEIDFLTKVIVDSVDRLMSKI